MSHSILRKSKLLRISSKDRLNPTNENRYDFEVGLDDYFLHQVKKVVVKSIIIPNTSYNITDKNNKLIIDYNGVIKLIALQTGQYTSFELEDAIITAFALIGVTLTIAENQYTKVYELTFDQVTSIISITNSLNTYGQLGTLHRVLGLDVLDTNDTPSGLTYTAPHLRDLSGLKKVYIGSNTLGNTTSLISSDKTKRNIFTEVDIEAKWGYIEHRVIDDLNNIDEHTYYAPKDISVIDISLYDQNLEPLDLNGHEFELVLKIFGD